MSTTVEEILGSAMALPESERLEIAEALFASSEPPSPQSTGDEWLAELRRRSNQIESGTAILTPWAEVKRRVRSRLQSRSRG